MNIRKFIKSMIIKGFKYAQGSQTLPPQISESDDEKMTNYILQNKMINDPTRLPPMPDQWKNDPVYRARFGEKAFQYMGDDADFWLSTVVYVEPASVDAKRRQNIQLSEDELASHSNAQMFMDSEVGRKLVNVTPKNKKFNIYFDGDEEATRSVVYESIRRVFEGRKPGDGRDDLRFLFFLQPNGGLPILKLQPNLWAELDALMQQSLGMNADQAIDHWLQLPGKSTERKTFRNRIYEILNYFIGDGVDSSGMPYYGINSLVKGIIESGSGQVGEVGLNFPPKVLRKLRNFILQNAKTMSGENTKKTKKEREMGIGSLDTPVGDNMSLMDTVRNVSSDDPVQQAIENEKLTQQIEDESNPQEKARLIIKSTLDNMDNFNEYYRENIQTAIKKGKTLSRVLEGVMPDFINSLTIMAEKTLPNMKGERLTKDGVDRDGKKIKVARNAWKIGDGNTVFGYDLLSAPNMTDLYNNPIGPFLLDGVPSFSFDDAELASVISSISDFKGKVSKLRYEQGLDEVTVANVIAQETGDDPQRVLDDVKWTYAQLDAYGGPGGIKTIQAGLLSKKGKESLTYSYQHTIKPFFRKVNESMLYESMHVDVRRAIAGIFPNRASFFAGAWAKPTEAEAANPDIIKTKLANAFGWSNKGFEKSYTTLYYKVIGMDMPESVIEQWKHYQHWRGELAKLTKKGILNKTIKVASRDYALLLTERYLESSKKVNKLNIIRQSMTSDDTLLRKEIAMIENEMGDLFERICDECGYT